MSGDAQVITVEVVFVLLVGFLVFCFFTRKW